MLNFFSTRVSSQSLRSGIKVHALVHDSIRRVEWPPGAGSFTIYPESGKGRGQGNGVKPIKLGLIEVLRRENWAIKEPLDLATSRRAGKFDAVWYGSQGPVAVEWETGNISSSHRALNKMALGLLKGALLGGILIVPSRALYRFLTDRVGNWPELEPYLDLWKALPCPNGILEICVIVTF